MSAVAFGSKEFAKSIKEYFTEINNEPTLNHDFDYHNMSRSEKLKYAAKMFAKISLYKDQKYNLNDISKYYAHYFSFPFSQPTGVTQLMFIPAIKTFGTDKQIKRWLHKIITFEIIGCYAQTELGHGSDVQSLETTSTYDFKTQTFIIDSPTLTATKWWIGELGLWSTHALVFAQLIISGKNYGVQPFVVQIRDMKTMQPLPGVQVGDVGPKIGLDTKDNGYLSLKKIRIPRENMLMRYTKVSKRGEFSKPANEKLGYAIMVQTRLTISTKFFPRTLGQALTIAIRYSLIRKQFKDSNGQERVILDYQSQQAKLFPALAELYAIIVSGYKIQQMNDEMMARINKKSDFSMLNEMHNIACGAKALYTEGPLKHLEICRSACGGHGYSYFSGLPSLIEEYKPLITLEGENTILLLQVARYLTKCCDKASKGKEIPSSVNYLKDCNQIINQKCQVKTMNEFRNLENLKKALQVYSVQMIMNSIQKLMDGIGQGKTPKTAWNEYAGIALVEGARAHMVYFTASNFIEYIYKCQNEKIRNALTKLCLLYCITQLLEHSIGVIQSEYFQKDHFFFLSELRLELLQDIRFDSLGFVEAFYFQDAQLRSAIALKDGKIYEKLLSLSEKNSTNKTPLEGMVHIKKLKDIRPKL